MLPFAFLTTTFFLLIVTRRQINHSIFRITILLTGSRTFGTVIYSLLFLPGTIIHELSHLIMALLLRVPAGKLNLIPKIDSQARSISLGSVKIAKVDFVRQSLIGAAPTIIGSCLIYSLVNLYFSSLTNPASLQSFFTSLNSFFFNQLYFYQFIALYLIFTISSTLHTSPSDRTGWPLLGLLVTLIVIAVYLLGGFKLVPPGFTSLVNSLSLSLSLAFIFAIILNFFIILLFYFVESSLGFILGKRVVTK